MIKRALSRRGRIALAFSVSWDAYAQEFSIATGSGITFGGCGASDVTTVLGAIMGDASTVKHHLPLCLPPPGTLVAANFLNDGRPFGSANLIR